MTASLICISVLQCVAVFLYAGAEKIDHAIRIMDNFLKSYKQSSSTTVSSAKEPYICRALLQTRLGCMGTYRVATNSRLHKIIGLFCKRALQKRLYPANETHNLKEPTNRSHLIGSPQ